VVDADSFSTYESTDTSYIRSNASRNLLLNDLVQLALSLIFPLQNQKFGVIFLFGVEWNRVHYYRDYWHIVPALMMDDDECGAMGGMLVRGNLSTRRRPATVPLCPPQIPHGRGSNSDRCGGKPASNRLSYGTAKFRG
jgi:hypothetical protein